MGLWDIDKIPYVGREKGPQEGLAFHYYDADKVVAGKKMKDWLRFGVAWWHTFDQQLVDPFGTGTAQRPWYGKYSDPEDEALAKVDYAFEFFQKLGVEYFCFHDRDIAPEGDMIRINIPETSLELLVSDEELAKRKANWQPREPKVTTGYLARYAAMVTSGNRGAILEVPKK